MFNLGTIKLRCTNCLFYVDIDKCDEDNGGCQHICKDTDGAFICKCHNGYEIMDDNSNCKGTIYIDIIMS